MLEQLSAIELALWNDAITLVEAHAGVIVAVVEKVVDLRLFDWFSPVEGGLR